MKITTYVSAMSIYGQTFNFETESAGQSMIGELVVCESVDKLNPGTYIVYDRIYKLSECDLALPYFGKETMPKSELRSWLDQADQVEVTVSYDDGCPDWTSPARIIVVK